MRLLNLICIVALAAFAAAAPAVINNIVGHVAVRDDAPSAQADTISASPLTFFEPPKGLESLFNTTFASLDPQSKFHANIHVLQGGPRQHVGQYKFNELRDGIKKCIEDNTCNDKYSCSFSDPNSEPAYCRINNVCYNAKNKKSCEAHMQVTPWGFKGIDWNGEHAYQVRKALIEAAAVTYATQTTMPGNCHDFHGETWCNIHEYVFVNFGGGGKAVSGQLNVHINFNGPTTEGPAHCMDSLVAVKNAMLDNVVPILRPVWGDKTFIEAITRCDLIEDFEK